MPVLAAAAPPPVPVSQPAPQQMVNALYSAFGDNHARAVHAKGIMAVGAFEPSAEARTLTKAKLFFRQVDAGAGSGFLILMRVFQIFQTRSVTPTRGASRSSSRFPTVRPPTSSPTASTAFQRRPPKSFVSSFWPSA